MALVLESRVRLIRIDGAGEVPIDGALAEPANGTAVAAVVHLHGKGGNFYTGPGRFIPDRTPAYPIVHLSINMHCHDLAYTRYDIPSPDFTTDDVPTDGGFWERISQGHLDVAAAVEFLRAQGHERVFLSGHSSGGFYAVDYAARDDRIAGVALLSPLTSNRTALPRWFPGEGELDRALESARRMVAEGRGRHLIPLTSWYYAISAQALLERAADTDDGWEQRLARLGCRALMIWGEAESRHELWTRIVRRIGRPDVATLSLPGCEHHFAGFEDEVAAAVADFVTAS